MDPPFAADPAHRKDHPRDNGYDEPRGIAHRLGDCAPRALLQSSVLAGHVAAGLEFDHEGLVALLPAPDGAQDVTRLAVRDWNRHHALPSRMYTALFRFF